MKKIPLSTHALPSNVQDKLLVDGVTALAPSLYSRKHTFSTNQSALHLNVIIITLFKVLFESFLVPPLGLTAK